MEKIYCGDALERLRTIGTESVNTCVTSPPYYNLRDYGTVGQIGMEDSPEAYIDKLVEVFREVRRVLRADGTLWLNIGDSYATRSGANPPTNTRNSQGHTAKRPPAGYKYKDLMGIPWLLAFALRADGWYLRQDIIWHKTNAMPESVRDRCTKAHEYIFLLSKSSRYYFNAEAIREPCGTKGNARTFRGGGAYTSRRSFHNSAHVERESQGNTVNSTGTRNKRSVWNIATAQFKAAHYATFPEKTGGAVYLGRMPRGWDRFGPIRWERHHRSGVQAPAQEFCRRGDQSRILATGYGPHLEYDDLRRMHNEALHTIRPHRHWQQQNRRRGGMAGCQ